MYKYIDISISILINSFVLFSRPLNWAWISLYHRFKCSKLTFGKNVFKDFKTSRHIHYITDMSE